MKKESTKVEETVVASIARRDAALVLALAVIAVTLRALPGPRTIDDAYITFRYARNLVEGVGFVYNPGEHVLGTTTPLYAALLACLSALTGSRDFPALAVIVNTGADLLTITLLYLAALRVSGSRLMAGVLGLLWATTTMSVAVTVLGMETSVYILWIIAALYAYLTGRDALAAAGAALGLLTRPDALIWAAPLLLHQSYTRWRAGRGRPLREWVPWRAWLAFAALLLPWLAFSAAYFGSPLPHSMIAKSEAFRAPPYLALNMLWRQLAMPFFDQLTFGPSMVFIGSFVYPALFVAGAVSAARRAPRLLPFLAYPVLYLIVFSVANPFIYRWYLVPPLPLWLLGVAAGVWYIAGALARVTRLLLAQPGALLAGAALALLCSYHAWSWRAVPPEPPHPMPATVGDDQEQAYRRIAERLVAERGADSDTRIASLDIGALGYYSNAAILDLAGLVSPESLDYYPVPPEWIRPGEAYALPTALILDFEPDYLVVLETHALPRLTSDEAFRARYRLLWRETVEVYGNILVFQHDIGDET